MPKLDRKTRSRRSGATCAGAVNVVSTRGPLLAQAESEGCWQVVSVGAWAGRGQGAEAGAGRRAARDAAVALERTRGIGVADKQALVAMRHSEL
jgi:hypothetical protein